MHNSLDWQFLNVFPIFHCTLFLTIIWINIPKTVIAVLLHTILLS